MKGTWVSPKARSHMSQSSEARALQLLKPVVPGACAPQERPPQREARARQQGAAPAWGNWRKLSAATKAQCSQKQNKYLEKEWAFPSQCLFTILCPCLFWFSVWEVLLGKWASPFRSCRMNPGTKVKKWKLLSCVWLFATSCTIALQAPQSMGFSRQEYWGGCPCPLPGDLPNPGVEPRSPTFQVDSLPSEPQRKPKNIGVGSLSLLQGIFLTQGSTLQELRGRGIQCLSSK